MPRYSIQEHKATKLHWDLRLERLGTLRSWAITKAPPKSAGTKRLAIKTPNHPRSYWNFEGEIEEGYGKGTVKLWDIGEYNTVKWKRDEIIIDIKGKRLNGEYCLIRFKTKEGKPEWLFFKKKR